MADAISYIFHMHFYSIYLDKYYFDILFWKKIGRSQLTSPANNFYEEFWYQLIKKSKDCVKDVSYHPYHYHDKDFTTINFKEFRICFTHFFIHRELEESPCILGHNFKLLPIFSTEYKGRIMGRCYCFGNIGNCFRNQVYLVWGRSQITSPT